MINPIFIIIGLVVLYVFFTKWRIRRRASSKSSEEEPIVCGYSQKDQRRYMAETVPVLLEDYKVLLPSYYSRFASEYLKTGHEAKIRSEDIIEGVNPQEALWCLNHCCYLASMRFSVIDKIQNAEKVEARYIKFSVFRSNPFCSLVPKDNKYKVRASIPIYPCADCKEEKPCIFFYDYEW